MQMKSEIRRMIYHGAGVICTLLLLLLLPLREIQAEVRTQVRTHYAIDLTLTSGLDEGATLREKLRVTVVNTSQAVWEEVCFRDYVASVIAVHDRRQDEPSGLTSGVISATCEGRTLTVRTEGEDGSIVYIGLEKPLAPGECTVLEMTYEAQVPMGGYRLGAFPLDAEGEGMTFELAQFYPMLAVWENGCWETGEYFTDGECFYTRCADFDLTVRVPQGYLVIASGDEQRAQAQEGMDVWQVSAQNMRDVTVIVTNEMEMISGEYEGVTVNSYFTLDEGSRRQGEISLEAAGQAIAAFTEAYGDYPYKELDVVESNYEFGGMEAPGLVRISQLYSWFIGEENSQKERADYSDRLRGTVAHEVAHEWFYGVVGNDQYNEAWLDESLAAYSEQVYWRSVGRDESETEELMAELETHISNSGDETVNRSYEELTSGADYDYTRAVYQRGAAFLYRLEQAMGQEEFFDFLREYYAEFAFKEAHTEDFIRLLSPHIAENEAAQALVERYLGA